MTAVLRARTSPAEGLWARLDQRGRVAALALVAATTGFMGSQGPTLARALVGAAGLLIFVLIAFSARDHALVLVVVWLVVLGFVRRALIPFAGWADNDPLLLISPAAAITFLLAARGKRPKLPHSALSGLATFLLLWSGFQIFNPNEPNLVVAVQGAMFWVVPMLWFFVGRTLTGAQHDRIINAVFWVAIIVVAHGLYQTFFDLLPFEYTWLGVSRQNAAIFLSGFRVRPFSTLASPQEYGQFLAFALVIIWAKILYFPPDRLPRNRRWLVLFFLVSLVALFYQGTRTSFVFFLLAFAVTTVLRLRSPVLLLLILLGGLGLANWVGSQDVREFDSGAAAEGAVRSDLLARHTISGLTNPSASTLPEHIARIEASIGAGLRSPLGIGVSQKSIAGARYDPSKSASAENDIANTMEGLGTVAGFTYVGFVVACFAAAVRMHRRGPSARHLAWLGMLIAATTQWWNGALYATSTILFLSLGGLARETAEVARADRVAVHDRLRALAPGRRCRG